MAPYYTCVHSMFQTKSSLLKIDGVGNVLEEAPVKLANSVLLFCKGLGWLTSVNLPGVERRRSTDGQVSGRHPAHCPIQRLFTGQTLPPEIHIHGGLRQTQHTAAVDLLEGVNDDEQGQARKEFSFAKESIITTTTTDMKRV